MYALELVCERGPVMGGMNIYVRYKASLLVIRLEGHWKLLTTTLIGCWFLSLLK